MRLILCTLTLLALSCNTHRYAFNDGPPRATCQAEQFFAQVGKPWAWACTISGNLQPYAQETIGVQLTTYRMDEFPTRSLSDGLRRMYGYHTTFDASYYLVLMGKQPWEPGERPDTSGPAPTEPIEGWEASFDGTFWIKVEFFLVEMQGSEALIRKKLTESTVRGRLACNSCAV